ncbi:MAG: AlbA family DNA-binding domain-containing protein [Thermodesulfobacteriota bacterium]
MTQKDFEELLARAYEQSGIEYKGPGARSNKPFLAKVTRAALSMGNRRDGGFIVIGVEDDAGNLKPVGLNETDLATWKYDDVSDSFSEYADPSVAFELEVHENRERKYVVLVVKEFTDVPILCKKGYSDNGREILRKGACYVRSRRKPETTEIPLQEDMRDLLDLAIEKGVRKFVAQSRSAGLAYVTTTSQSTAPTDSDRFVEQLSDFR